MHPLIPLVLMLAPAGGHPCAGPLSRAAVVACARERNPDVIVDTAYLDVVDGRIDAARVILPSNPRASVNVLQRRNTTGASTLNVSGTLSQELEIGGQRRKRGATQRAHREAAQARIDVTARSVEAAALVSYFDVLAARAELEIVQASVETADRLEDVAAGRSSAGLGAPLDVDLAAAHRATLVEELALARGRVDVARSRLAATIGLDPTGTLPPVTGELEPLPRASSSLAALTDDAVRSRPELAHAGAVRRAQQARVAQLRRERIPNPSLSFFVQSDGFNERVIGGGLSFPITLPAPLGRTERGEIQSARAEVRQTDARIDALGRQALAEVAIAFHEQAARREAVAAYPDDAAARAAQTLQDLADEIGAGRIDVKDALTTEQALLDLLLHRVEARHQLCLASVRVLLAAGISFEEAAR